MEIVELPVAETLCSGRSTSPVAFSFALAEIEVEEVLFGSLSRTNPPLGPPAFSGPLARSL